MLRKIIKKQISLIKRFPILVKVCNYNKLRKWEREGKPVPPPHIVKQRVINHYRQKYGYSILVETGTYRGDMVEAQRKNFKQIISIEVSKDLFEKARERFIKESHIEILLGDSANILPLLIKEIDKPAIFWLDGHYSGGVTEKGKRETPILEELRAVLGSKQRHVILIDDARLFWGEKDYPTINEIEKFVKQQGGGSYRVEVSDDIIRCIPRRDSS